MEKETLVRIVTELVLRELEKIDKGIPVGISARHVHLSQDALDVLFGQGYELMILKELSQPGQYAANEIVELVGPKGNIGKVRILGPIRKEVQVEIAMSDARKLGVEPVVRGSGDLEGTPGIILKGPKGELFISQGVIVAERHLHASCRDAERLGLSDGEKIRVYVEGPKSCILNQVVVRVNEGYKLDLHIDTDDANAFMINQNDRLVFEKLG